VQVWILNRRGEFLCSKRTEGRPWGGYWECTGGSAISGDDSLTTALKEVKEELGITLDPDNGNIFTRIVRPNPDESIQRTGYGIIDVWLFRQDVPIEDVVLCPDETTDARWMCKAEILSLIGKDQFIGYEFYPYLKEMFAAT